MLRYLQRSLHLFVLLLITMFLEGKITGDYTTDSLDVEDLIVEDLIFPSL